MRYSTVNPSRVCHSQCEVTFDPTGARTAEGFVSEALSAVRTLASDRLSGKKTGSSGQSGRGGGNGGSGSTNDIIELTDSNFESLVLNSDDMWLVEFFAPW